MRVKSTEIMQQIIQFAEEYYRQNGVTPSTTVISRKVGLDKSNVYRYLVDMDKRGMIQYDGHTISTDIIRKYHKEQTIAAKVGSIRCGTPEYEEENIEGYYSLPADIFGRGSYYILQAKGDSMVGADICEGDLIVVRKTLEAEDGDIIVALLNGENTLKRCLKKPDGSVVLHPENSSMEDIPIGPEDEFYIQGIATHVIKHIASSVDNVDQLKKLS